MSTRKLGRTQNWLFEQAYEGALIDGLPADKVKAGDERQIQQLKDLQLYSWVKETDIPPNTQVGLGRIEGE